MKLSMGIELKHIILALHEILEGRLILECKKSGLYCKMMDDANVCLIETFIHTELMTEYNAMPGEVVSLDMGLLYKVFKTIKFDTIHLENTQTSMKIVSNGQHKCEFEIPLIDTLLDDITIPNISYDCSFSMETSAFQGLCKDLKQFGELIVVDIQSNNIIFSARDEIECKLELPNLCLENKDNHHIQKQYDLKYFLKMLKANTLAKNVWFYVSQTMPLVVEYKIEQSYIRYYLGNII